VFNILFYHSDSDCPLFMFDPLSTAASDSSSYFDDEDSCEDDDHVDGGDEDNDTDLLYTRLMITNSIRYLSSSFHSLFFLLRIGIIGKLL
jgi:hypothetical protein